MVFRRWRSACNHGFNHFSLQELHAERNPVSFLLPSCEVIRPVFGLRRVREGLHQYDLQSQRSVGSRVWDQLCIIWSAR